MRHALVLLASTVLAASASAQAPTIPSTPAGGALRAWLDAFNSGDRARIQGFLDRYRWATRPIDAELSFRSRTGGFDLVSIEHSTPQVIEFMTREHRRGIRAIGRLATLGDPPQVTSLTLSAIPSGATVLGYEIDAAARDSVIDGSIAKLRERYVFEDIAEAMADAVDGHRRRGDYDAVTDGFALATLLTTHLRDVSHDLHLRVAFTPFAVPRPPDNPGGDPAGNERYRAPMARINCGFQKVEILDGNVGYLEFNQFANPTVCGPTATAAMNFLQHVDALIIDMRENGGGDPAMVAYVATYLFDMRTHLNDLYNRVDDSTQQWWTLPYVPGERLADQPVYVLTSHRTFSGAEEFSYDLKSRGRATIVGDSTGGGAHLVRRERLNDQFAIDVPFARAINPVTKTNWEGTGVEPDVAVSAAEALDKALELISNR